MAQAPVPGVMAFFVQHMPYLNQYFPQAAPARGPAPPVTVPYSPETRQFKGGISGMMSFYGQNPAQVDAPTMTVVSANGS